MRRNEHLNASPDRKERNAYSVEQVSNYLGTVVRFSSNSALTTAHPLRGCNIDSIRDEASYSIC